MLSCLPCILGWVRLQSNASLDHLCDVLAAIYDITEDAQSATARCRTTSPAFYSHEYRNYRFLRAVSEMS